MYLLARVGTRAGTALYSASLGQPGQFIYLPVLVLVLVPLVQCFAWSARAINLFARVHTCAVCESLHSVYCACIPCTVLRLVRTGNVSTCPCSYSYWYLLYIVSLGQHGQCTYLRVVVLVLVSARVRYLLARIRTRTGTSCAVLRLDSTSNVPTCPWWYSYSYLLYSASLGQHGLYTYVPVLVSLYSVCAVLRLDSTGNVPTCPWSYSYWYFLCSASLGQHGQCTYLPVVVLVLVPLVQCFAWTAHGLCTYVPVFVSMYSVCAVLRLDSTGNVPTCPWSYSYWYLLCSASLGQYELCTYVPVLVSLYSVLLWVIRAMYVSSCLDSRAVLVALLLLTWTVCW